MTDIRHKLLPKQAALIRAAERHTVYSGAVGAGKSRALCIAAVLHVAGRPHTRFGLFRKTRVGIVKSTLKTLLDGDGFAPAVLPRGSYTHNKTLGEIQVNGGGMILYTGVETPESVRSMNLTQAGVDEVTELTAEDYNAVDDRVRVDIGEPLRILSATNPGPPSHWLAKMMGLSPEKQSPDPDCRIILTKTADNTYLPQRYIESFNRHAGTLYYRRMFLGEWCGSDGLVFDRWSREVHVRTTTAPPRRVLVCVDEGYTDPFAALRLHLDPDGRVHVAREVYETRLTQDEKIERTRELVGDDACEVVVDSAAPDLIESMRRKGLNSQAANKGQGSVNYGIGLVQGRLVPAGDGLPRLTVDPNCTNLIREFESYEWKPGGDRLKDEPLDANNHALDSLRYGIRHLDTGDTTYGFTRARKPKQHWAQTLSGATT
jgi:phage terminase large subunit